MATHSTNVFGLSDRQLLIVVASYTFSLVWYPLAALAGVYFGDGILAYIWQPGRDYLPFVVSWYTTVPLWYHTIVYALSFVAVFSATFYFGLFPTNRGRVEEIV